jgi:tetratricopeptide (TPR) repeat protein
MIILFAIDIIGIRHAWTFILPFAIITFDYFFLEKKKGQLFYKYFLSWIIPIILLFIIFNFSGQYTQRLLSRNESGKVLQNQQALIPVIQGYPYTIYNLMRLYFFPKDLTMYYDGNKVTTTTQLLMYGSLIMYVSAIIYFFKRDKKIAGVLLLLLVFILPVLSPKKITWFITERYLYVGTGFFTLLLAVLISNIEKKYKVTHLAYIITSLIFILYVGRTISRNSDWKNPETLAFATIKTSPYSVRAYNDVAGYYILRNNYNDAKIYYQKALLVSTSFTSVRNLGHLYLENGFDPKVKTINYPTNDIYAEALRMMKSQEYYAAAYYLNEIIAVDPNNTDALNRIVELYILYPNPQMAEVYLTKMIQNNIANADTFYLYAYIANTKGEKNVALEYANKALSIDPNHAATRQLLNQL